MIEDECTKKKCCALILWNSLKFKLEKFDLEAFFSSCLDISVPSQRFVSWVFFGGLSWFGELCCSFLLSDVRAMNNFSASKSRTK